MCIGVYIIIYNNIYITTKTKNEYLIHYTTITMDKLITLLTSKDKLPKLKAYYTKQSKPTQGLIILG